MHQAIGAALTLYDRHISPRLGRKFEK
jgi:hypothetical protein